MSQVETLIHARWIIPVVPDNLVLEHHALAIDEGRIVAILPSAQADQQFQAKTVHRLDHHALIPGLVNSHTHAAMSLMRGLADDLHLMDWLNNHIWPAEAKWVSPEFVYEGTQLAIAEMIRGGTTCFNDMYFFPEQTARAADHAGMRARVSLIMIDFPSAYAGNADEYLRKGLELHDQLHHHPLVGCAFGPHAPYTVSDAPLQRIVTLAEELDLQIQMHVHETAHEVAEAANTSGKRPIERLKNLGLLSPRLQAVHMTQLTDEEIELIAKNRVHVVHCPESNLKLASGFCPVDKLIKAGINVALGTDGAASNNDLDLFGEMRMAALLAKAVSGDASALPAATALRVATLNGAKALGLETEIGSLQVGKWADVVAVHMESIETQPIYHPVSQLVYATGRDKVRDVWVAGRHLLKDGLLTTLDEQSLIQKAGQWRARIQPSQ